MELSINTGSFGKMFGVPNNVVDSYIKLANENQLKILLILLRYNSQQITSAQIASFLNIPENEVENALEFWKNTNIFSNSSDAIKEPVLPNKTQREAKKVKVSENTSKPEQQTATPVKRESMMSPKVVAEQLEKSQELKMLFQMIEGLLNRNLNYKEQQGIIYIYKDLKMQAPVIVTLIKYCESINAININYIRKVAENWTQRGVKNLEDAEKCINEETYKRDFSGKIYRAFKLKNPLTSGQQEYVDLWHEKNYPFDLIVCAYENTIERINSVNFKYINTTLENWVNSGIKSADDVKRSKKTKNTYEVYEDRYTRDSDLDKYRELVNKFTDDYN
jgi:DnaD/phage-associated family protein